MNAPPPLAAHLDSAWPGLEITRALTGGARNEVYLAHLHDQPVVLRKSMRTAESLTWELELLEHLHRNSVPVPKVIRIDDGSLHAQGWNLQEYIDGRGLEDADHRPLADSLKDIHRLTRGWPQRPGGVSASDLISGQRRGGDIDLDAMPEQIVDYILHALAHAAPADQGAVHGDAGVGNGIITKDGRCVLIDWDEARVDDPFFDLTQAGRGTAEQHSAAHAWEVAVCWHTEPDYARSLLPAGEKLNS